MRAGARLEALYLAKDTGLTKHLSLLLCAFLLPLGMSQKQRIVAQLYLLSSNFFYVV